ncbi:MarR family transcriptional regulator [Gordonia sp. HY285]|uniref:MarR family transcriptional regulator n=1 Tax=Gordonia liuliyuniae TaxID=2911517 RepID=A0ABS9IWU6_9ACTN|nr:MarR family transcriptional regulator [Gordonia liuliyuniae]MCF8590045.1 MarR family transcriptional regulator [Gordonia liuliyuniae]MCF8610331.1 MarR family transcriptional regulator [Gordonia liuliyuniae]
MERNEYRSVATGEPEGMAQAADALYLAMRKARTAHSSGGLSQAQIALLDPLSSPEDALAVGQLAGKSGVTIPTATRMLQQLESKGILTRRRSQEDERRVLVSLTVEGAELLGRHRVELRGRQLRAAQIFTSSERAQLIEYMRRLTTVIMSDANGEVPRAS